MTLVPIINSNSPRTRSISRGQIQEPLLDTAKKAELVNIRLAPIYKVTNEQGVESFLLCTMHAIDKKSLDDHFFPEIIEKCSSLHTESGLLLCDEFPNGSKNEETPQYQPNPFRYMLDLKITELAKKRKIPVISLDRGLPEKNALAKQVRTKRLRLGNEEMEKIVRSHWEKVSKDPSSMLIFNRWRDGDIGFFKKIRACQPPNESCSEREAHWFKTLIPKIQRARKSICVAVGTYHVIGKGSLTEKCREAKLQVELVTAN